MKYIVDSDYIADYLVGKSDATTLLSSLAPEGITVSLITVGEIYEGIYYSYHPKQAEVRFEQFLNVIDTLPLNKSIMQNFARIRGELRRTGKIIGDFDILIAATAIHHNLTLVTRNLKDYSRISNLKMY